MSSLTVSKKLIKICQSSLERVQAFNQSEPMYLVREVLNSSVSSNSGYQLLDANEFVDS